MKVLVACEFSGIVRDAFIRNGHDAISCDLLPSESSFGPHLQCDVLTLSLSTYDLVIAHPPCTFLANSGLRWLFEDGSRWNKMVQAATFFNALLNCGAKYVAVENPSPHGYAYNFIPHYQQIIQPYHFGDDYSKGICLWLRNLPKLLPTTTDFYSTNSVHRIGNKKERQKERSRFFIGVANAMAEQWGRYIHEVNQCKI